MLACPACASPMIEHRLQGVVVDVCPRCKSRWFDPGEPERLGTPIQAALGPGASTGLALGRRCPRCRVPMRVHLYREGLGVPVDLCPVCHGIHVSRASGRRLLREAQGGGRWLRSRENPRLADAFEYYRRAAPGLDLDGRTWMFQLLTGLPLESNLPPLRAPVVTYALIGLNVLVFFITAPTLERTVTELGIVPARFLEVHDVHTLFTSMFLHGGLLHLLGNMYFLHLMGDNVEDVLGRFRYLVYYLACGVAGALAFVALHPGSTIPCVGASGAISGIMGGYLIACPRASVTWLIFFQQVKVPAVAYLGFWIFFQILAWNLGSSNVAYEAHVAGFATGLVLMLLLRAWIRSTARAA
jgi:membrane associated rhomboid family serine protease